MDQARCTKQIQSAIETADHPLPPDPELYQPTSVMALFLFNSDPSLLFIQKADTQGYPWRNQMAFPGGHVDKKDASPKVTALRELNEEMGIIADNVAVTGSIGHFQTLNNKDIQAFTGIWNQKDQICFDREEISRVFKIPFALLETIHKEKGYAGRQPSIMELTYPYEDVVIWGVTAKILHHLIEVVQGFRG
ncbi:MAG: CoA pyrophosphatase [Desulfobacter sp.]|nr:CoA pyrophosphatase [Desulfobacter sp.]